MCDICRFVLLSPPLFRRQTVQMVRPPSLQICFTRGKRRDGPSLLDEADSEKYSTVTSFPTFESAPGHARIYSTHNEIRVLAKLDTLVRSETTSYRYPDALVLNPDICHRIILPKHPIYRQPHPRVLDVNNSIFSVLPFLEFPNIAPSYQPWMGSGLTI